MMMKMMNMMMMIMIITFRMYTRMLKMYTFNITSIACLIKRHHDRDDDRDNVDETPSCEGNVESVVFKHNK